MIIFCFSSTGNSLALTKKISSKYFLIQDVLNSNVKVYQDDKIGIIFPCYAYNCPKIVERFLNQITLKTDYLFAIVTYGNELGGVEYMIDKIGKKNNIKFNYINHVKMVQNYLPEFDMRITKKINDKFYYEYWTDIISKDIENKKNRILKMNKINIMISYINYIQIKLGLILNKKEAKKFIIDYDKCIGCNTCIKFCPTDNIFFDVKTKKIQYKNKCEVCFGCAHICPVSAIYLKKETCRERYLNDEITIKELIKKETE